MTEMKPKWNSFVVLLFSLSCFSFANCCFCFVCSWIIFVNISAGPMVRADDVDVVSAEEAAGAPSSSSAIAATIADIICSTSCDLCLRKDTSMEPEGRAVNDSLDCVSWPGTLKPGGRFPSRCNLSRVDKRPMKKPKTGYG